MRRQLTGGQMIYALLAVVLILVFFPFPALADQSCICARCYKMPGATQPGTQIINGIFSAINALLTAIGAAMYTNILGNSSFTNILGAMIIVYIAVYGLMIMLNMTSYRYSEVTVRLIKICIVYAFLSSTTGWTTFVAYAGNFFLGGMNELIQKFSSAAGFAVTPASMTPSTALQLQTSSMTALIAPMNSIISPFYFISIIGMLFCGYTGWIFSLVLAWALFDFVLMIIGALITYIKSLVGLTFLFGIAPIFIVCLLFEKTRNIFQGWLNQVIAFSISPILVFAFLAFFCKLLADIHMSMFSNVDFCWAKFTGMVGTLFDLSWWRPKMLDTGTVVAGDFADNWGTTPKPPPINIVNLLFFVITAHLGKAFTNYLEELGQMLASGIGPGVTRGVDAGGYLKHRVTGNRGRADMIGDVAKGTAVTMYRGGRSLATGFANMTGLRGTPSDRMGGRTTSRHANTQPPRAQQQQAQATNQQGAQKPTGQMTAAERKQMMAEMRELYMKNLRDTDKKS